MNSIVSVFRVYAVCTALALLSGCALKTGTITHAPEARISIVGEVANASANIDGAGSVALVQGHSNLLPVAPGRHHVRVERAGTRARKEVVRIGQSADHSVDVGNQLSLVGL